MANPNSLEKYAVTKKVLEKKLKKKIKNFTSELRFRREDSDNHEYHEVHYLEIRFSSGEVLKLIAKAPTFHEGEEQVYDSGLPTVPKKIGLRVHGKNRVLLMEYVGERNLESIIFHENYGRPASSKAEDVRKSLMEIIRASVESLAYTHRELKNKLLNANIRRMKSDDYLKQFSRSLEVILCSLNSEWSRRRVKDKHKKQFFSDIRRYARFMADSFENATLTDKEEYGNLMRVIGHTDLHLRHIFSKKFDEGNMEINPEDIRFIDFQPAIVPGYFDLVDMLSDPVNMLFTGIVDPVYLDGQIYRKYKKDHRKELLIENYLKVLLGGKEDIVKGQSEFKGLVKEFEKDAISMYYLGDVFRSIRAASKPILMKKHFSENSDEREKHFSEINPLYGVYPLIYLNTARSSGDYLLEKGLLGEYEQDFLSLQRTLGRHLADFNNNKPDWSKNSIAV